MFLACSRCCLASSVTWRRSTTWIEVHAEARHHRLGDAADIERGDRLLELGHERAGRGPAEVAALRGAGVLGVLAGELLEALAAGEDLAPELGQPARRRLGGQLRPRARSRMWRARVCWTLKAVVLALDQLEDVKAGGAAQQVGRDFARPSMARTALTNTSGRRSAGRMPISPPAARLPSCDTSRATAAKSSPPRTRAQRRQRALAPLADNDLGGVFRHQHQDLRDVELGVGAAALRRSSIRASISASLIRIAARDLALAHPLDHHLVPMLERNFAYSMPSAAQPLAQLRHRELVLRGDVGDGTVELGLVDPRAALARSGDQHALVDQHVEHLLAQRRRRRQLAAGAAAPRRAPGRAAAAPRRP